MLKTNNYLFKNKKDQINYKFNENIFIYFIVTVNYI